MISCPHCKTPLIPKDFQPACSSVLSTATDISSPDKFATFPTSGSPIPKDFVKVSLFVCPKCGFEEQILED
jgi:hypothetical protein